MYGDFICFGLVVVSLIAFLIYETIGRWRNPPYVPPPSITLSHREQIVLCQIMDAIKVDDHTLREEMLDLPNKPYVKDFVPTEGQIRLSKEEWEAFYAKIKTICEL